MQYTIVIEQAPSNFAAYVPDLPGCIATGTSREDVIRQIREAIEYHIESLREHGDPVPAPLSTATVVDVVPAERLPRAVLMERVSSSEARPC